MLTRDEIAGRLKVPADTVKIWARYGLLRRHPCNDKHECLYEPPGPDVLVKIGVGASPIGVDGVSFRRIRPMTCSMKRSP